MRHVYVDLDNISFFDSRFDGGCLSHRIRQLQLAFAGSKMHFFCNNATAKNLAPDDMDSLKKYDVHVTPVSRDSADHALLFMLLHNYNKHNTVTSARSARHAKPVTIEYVVVTADKTLGRLASYFCTSQDKNTTSTLKFALFVNASPGACEQLLLHDANRFALTFNDREDFDKFSHSLQLFQRRYLPNLPAQ